jgi:uncharacterized protein YbbC (DUF1343 family)
LLSNHTGVDREGRRDVDRLREAHVRVVALFSPEHGFRGTEDRPALPDAVDAASGLPIYSLYRGARPPTLTALDELDVVLIDLQDIGARYYTYVTTAAFLLREAARRGRPVIVLDRPNPIGGAVQGNVRPAPAPLEAMVGVLPVAMRHGMTLGELLRLADDVYHIGARLTVVPTAGWRRDVAFDGTGLPWVPPSPNMPNLESAWHYPGTCLFEGTNLSVGRGTPFAFQVVAAPWLEPDRVLETLPPGSAGWRGVEVSAVAVTPRAPSDGKYDGVALPGLRFRVTDRERYDPTRAALALLAALRRLYPDSLQLRAPTFDGLAGGPALRAALLAGAASETLWAKWDRDLERFRVLRGKYLLY